MRPSAASRSCCSREGAVAACAGPSWWGEETGSGVDGLVVGAEDVVGEGAAKWDFRRVEDAMAEVVGVEGGSVTEK